MLLGGKYSSLQVEVPPKDTRMEEEQEVMEHKFVEQDVLAEDLTTVEDEIEGVATTLHSNNGDKRKGQEEPSNKHKKAKSSVLKNITTYADKVVEASKKVNSRKSKPDNNIITTDFVFFKPAVETKGSEDEGDKEKENEEKEEKVKQRRMNQRRKDPIKDKSEGRSKKTNLNSFKSKYITLKKKVSALQMEVGTEPDFILIVKNNLQENNVNNSAATAGKYMVYGEGPLKEKLIEDGIKFKTGEMYLMANNFDYQEEGVEEKEEGVEEVVEEELGRKNPKYPKKTVKPQEKLRYLLKKIPNL